MNDQGLNEKLQEFENRIRPLQQQLQSVEQAISDLTYLNSGLGDIKEGQEILAPVGRGIFVRAKTLSEELTVDVGGKRYVKKSIPDTKDLISKQLKKIKEVREELNEELKKIDGQLTKTMMNYQKGSS